MSIKTVRVEMDTGPGAASTLTSKITGKLLAIRVISDVELELTIALGREGSSVICQKRVKPLNQYWALRAQAVDWKGERINYSFVEYVIDHQLLIQIKGAARKAVAIELVFETFSEHLGKRGDV